MHAAPALHAERRVRASKDHELVLVRQRPEAEQPLESRVVAVVRRRAEQQDAARPARERIGGHPTLRAAAHGVRLVDDDEIPYVLRGARQHVRLLQEIHRSDPHAGDIPRRRAAESGLHGALQTRGIRFVRVEAEVRLQFVRPLPSKERRHDHQDGRGGLACSHLRDHETGLDGLSQADGIGNQHAARARLHRERRLELVRMKIDVGVARANQGSAACSAGNQPRKPRDDGLRPDPGRAYASLGDARSVERREKRSRPRPPADLQPDDALLPAGALDSPSCLANPDERAGRGQLRLHDLLPRQTVVVPKVQRFAALAGHVRTSSATQGKGDASQVSRRIGRAAQGRSRQHVAPRCESVSSQNSRTRGWRSSVDCTMAR